MADLVYISSSKNVMTDIPIIGGQIIHATDVNETYYDSGVGIRSKIGNVTYFYTEEDRIAHQNPVQGQLYIVTSNANIYKYLLNIGWLKITTIDDMYDIVDTVDELTPGTIFRDGTKIAPKTLATNVYTSEGERVQDRLKTISKLGNTVVHTTIERNNITEFDIPIPFVNYFELGNYMQIFIGSILFDERRYYIENNKLKLFLADPEFSAGRDITFVFWFNSTTPPIDVSYAINGNYLVNNSIPTNKLSGIYHGLDISNPELLPSMQALNSAYTILSDKLNIIAGNLIAHAISKGPNGKDLQADITNFTLTDNNTIYLKLHTDLEAGATLSINGGTTYPIYLNYKEPVKSGLKTGDVLNITFSAMYSKFFVNASIAYRLQHYSYAYTAIGNETEIVIDISEFEPFYDALTVHQNSIRLYEHEHYIISGRKIVLLGYNANKNDLFLFEIDKVKGNGLPIDGNTIMKEIVFTEKAFFKNGVDITGDLDIKGNINLDGELHFSGGASSGSNFTAEQFISTAASPKPPMVVNSKTMVENFNADMVDGYHAIDLIIPDNSLEFIIDGETDILDPILQITFNSFYGRIEALNSRMVKKDNPNRIQVDKRQIQDYIPEGEIDPTDPLYISIIQDTIEDILWKLDNLKYSMLYTEECEFDIDDLNNMDGEEIPVGVVKPPVLVSFYNNIVDMNKCIDEELFQVEEVMLKAVAEDEEYQSVNNQEVLTTYSEVPTLIPVNYTTASDGTTQKTATRAKYLTTDGKRIYPITHKNAIVGLPNADLATVDDITKLQNTIALLTGKVEALEEIAGKASIKFITLLASSWSGIYAPFTQSVAVEGVLDTMEATMVSALPENVTLEAQSAYTKAYAIINSGYANIGNGVINFKVYKRPETDIMVGLRGI